MVHLNHFRKTKVLPIVCIGNILFVISSYAGVIQFFDPLQQLQDKTIKVDMKLFLANDPIALEEFFDDWHGKYRPRRGQNVALLDSRVDLNYYIKDHYFIGYFYQYSAFIDTDKDFTDLYYRAKNKKELKTKKRYLLNLEIDGIKQQGLIFSGDKKIYDNDRFAIYFGSAVYISYGLEMQNGYINGFAKAISTKDYDIHAYASYYYTHNYLYKLDVESPSGYGLGSHIGFFIENRESKFNMKFLINDLLSKIYWHDLP